MNGNDVSQYVGEWASCEESRAEWIVHTELIRNDVTSNMLRPLNDKSVRVKYRMRTPAGIFPWRSGSATVNWRPTETENEELILHGIGLLNKDESAARPTSAPITATIAKTTMIDGRLVQGEEQIGTIQFVEQTPQEKAIREAQLRLAESAEIDVITGPEFVLFLANSALSSYRLLHETGTLHQNSELLYSSLIFLPLAIEYYLKYLLLRRNGEFKKEYKNHKLLKLFDFLPFELQKTVEEEFQKELENTGRSRTPQDIRVFLRKSQNVFTVIRYLFEPSHAEEYRHLLKPENAAILSCVSTAVERVSRRV